MTNLDIVAHLRNFAFCLNENSIEIVKVQGYDPCFHDKTVIVKHNTPDVHNDLTSEVMPQELLSPSQVNQVTNNYDNVSVDPKTSFDETNLNEKII